LAAYGLVVTKTIDAPAHETVWFLTNAVVPARCLQLIAEIGVADRLREPATAAELAERCSVHDVALDRMLRLLVSHGIFERDGVVYRHNDASALLRSDHPRSMRAFARMMGLPVFAQTWDVLDHSLISEAPAIEHVAVGGLWPYLQSHPDEARIFHSAMESKAHADVGAVVSAYDRSTQSSTSPAAGATCCGRCWTRLRVRTASCSNCPTSSGRCRNPDHAKPTGPATSSLTQSPEPTATS
jgi:hypothetical protein